MSNYDRSRGQAVFDEIYRGDVGALPPEGASPYIDYMLETLFAAVWSDETLSIRERRLLLLGALTAQGDDIALGIHLRAAIKRGELNAPQLQAMAIFLTQYVPLWMSDNEAQFTANAAASFGLLKSSIDSQYVLGAPQTYGLPVQISSDSVPLLAQPTQGTLTFLPQICPKGFATATVQPTVAPVPDGTGVEVAAFQIARIGNDDGQSVTTITTAVAVFGGRVLATIDAESNLLFPLDAENKVVQAVESRVLGVSLL